MFWEGELNSAKYTGKSCVMLHLWSFIFFSSTFLVHSGKYFVKTKMECCFIGLRSFFELLCMLLLYIKTRRMTEGLSFFYPHLVLLSCSICSRCHLLATPPQVSLVSVGCHLLGCPLPQHLVQVEPASVAHEKWTHLGGEAETESERK